LTKRNKIRLNIDNRSGKDRRNSLFSKGRRLFQGGVGGFSRREHYFDIHPPKSIFRPSLAFFFATYARFWAYCLLSFFGLFPNIRLLKASVCRGGLEKRLGWALGCGCPMYAGLGGCCPK